MSGSENDRNLLFGLLALQNGFIDQAALVAAFQAWVQDKSRPLARILEDQGALSASRVQLIAILIDEHLADHEGDAARSLEAVSSVSSAREALRKIEDDEVQESLGHLRTGADEDASQSREPRDEQPPTEPGAEATISVQPGVAVGPRFRLLRHHAEGGLGIVSIAQDTELSRQVALKQIQGKQADKAESRARFLIEAEITGGLEHPGIVPVYSLGSDAQGRPYYAMRFIQGDSLRHAIATYHARKSTWDDGRRTLEFQKLLRRFLDVCETIAYAHSRGVLHRDLKPANIMVGRYGETLVVDWGLAKVVGAPEQSEERTLRPSSGSDSSDTLPGSAIGTPGYMSPEQMDGRLDQLGSASDVYSLGATLFALLTGDNPVAGRHAAEVLERARRGETRAPRDVDPTVPAALDAICRKAMARRPEDRYASPQHLADDIEAWLADEPVSAWTEPLPARARRWARRHQRAVSTAAGVALMGLFSIGALAVLMTLANRRLDAANTRIVAQNTQITRQNARLERINQRLALARAEAERERDRAEAVTDFLVKSFRSPDPELDGREITIAEVLDRASEELKERDDLIPRAKASILNAIGLSYAGLGLLQEELAIHRRALELRLEALGPDHPETLISQNNVARALLTTGRIDEAIERFEHTLEQRLTILGPTHRNTLTTQLNLASAYRNAGRYDDAIALDRETLEAQQETLGPDHEDTLTTQNNLASVLRAAGRLQESIELFEQTFEARRRVLGADHPSTLTSQSNLALAYEEAGHYDEALGMLERTLEIRRANLGADHPDTLATLSNLATLYTRMKRLDEAVELLERSLAGHRSGLGDDHPDTLSIQNNLAYVYKEMNRLEEAIALYEETLEATRARLGDTHPDTLGSQNNLASAYLSAGRLDEALVLLERTLEARRERLGPDHFETMISHNNVATAHMVLNRFKKAIPHLEAALRGAVRHLGANHPQTSIFRSNLAQAYLRAGQPADMERAAQAWVEAARQRQPNDAQDLAKALAILGEALVIQEHFDEAEPPLREALQLFEMAAPDHWMTARTESLLGAGLGGQARFEAAEHRLRAAESALRERADTIPGLHRARVLRESVERLATFYESWGKPDEAARWRQRLSDDDTSSARPELPEDVFARPRAEP